jgi:8-oxo-dGTP pyrophosphatase MutT (NUDIX family)
MNKEARIRAMMIMICRKGPSRDYGKMLEKLKARRDPDGIEEDFEEQADVNQDMKEKVAGDNSRSHLPLRERAEVIARKGDKILIQERDGYMEMPGGGLDGQSAKVGIRRETLEEAGAKLKNLKKVDVVEARWYPGIKDTDWGKELYDKYRGSKTHFFTAEVSGNLRKPTSEEGDGWTGTRYMDAGEALDIHKKQNSSYGMNAYRDKQRELINEVVQMDKAAFFDGYLDKQAGVVKDHATGIAVGHAKDLAKDAVRDLAGDTAADAIDAAENAVKDIRRSTVKGAMVGAGTGAVLGGTTGAGLSALVDKLRDRPLHVRNAIIASLVGGAVGMIPGSSLGGSVGYTLGVGRQARKLTDYASKNL